MVTSVDKALVGLLGFILFLVDRVWGINLGLDEGTLSAASAVLTPIFVRLVPNKAPDS